jgi:hypothetical protein
MRHDVVSIVVMMEMQPVLTPMVHFSLPHRIKPEGRLRCNMMIPAGKASKSPRKPRLIAIVCNVRV